MPAKQPILITGKFEFPVPTHPQYEKALGLYRAGKLEQAQAICQEILNTQPKHFAALHLVGIIAYLLNQPEQAITIFNQVLAIKFSDAHVYVNRGNAQRSLRKYALAIQDYDQAISIKPDLAIAYSNRGAVYQDLGQNQAALADYQKALEINPELADAHFNSGLINTQQKNYQAALANYDRVYAINPNYEFLYEKRSFLKMCLCDWSGEQLSAETVSAEIQRNAKAMRPFPVLAITDSLAVQKQVAELYARTVYPLNPCLPAILPKPRQQKLRIGYFSADFREHAVAYLTAELFENHDRSTFEIIAFSFVAATDDAMRTRLQAAFDQFIDVHDRSDKDIALLARDLQIDIAVDLGGYTQNCRAGVFAMRAAAIQVSYIGYLGTMGASYMDYLIADPIIIPEQSRQFYSEKIVYLPSYQANDSKRQIADKVFSRQELGLPEQGFVFCCFNNNYKLRPETFAGWMRILDRTQGSVLFLYAENALVEVNLKKTAQQHGINPDRIIFGVRLPRPDYLARFRVADLFLDSFPYNAGTTGSDALWAGLPILTYAGESFASRIAASLLTSIGLPELIATSQQDYENLAIELAINPEKLRRIRAKLAQGRLTSPLFNSQLFARTIEAAYQTMYNRHLSSLPIEHIGI